MKRSDFRLLAATVLAGSLSFAAHAQDTTGDAPDIEGQPVEGGETAPVPPEVGGGEGSVTMSGPENIEPSDDGDAAESSSDAGEDMSGMTTSSEDTSSNEDCPEDDDTAPGCDNTADTSDRQPVPGAATAPVEPDSDSGDVTMESPEMESESDSDDGS